MIKGSNGSNGSNGSKCMKAICFEDLKSGKKLANYLKTFTRFRDCQSLVKTIDLLDR